VDPPPVDVSTLRELYTTPPAEFVAVRNQLVKDRRAAKHRDAADALGKLRKPALADWALNVVAARHGDDVAAFLGAAGTVRDAQAAAIEGRAGPDIRAALRDLREHSGQVLSRAQEVLSEAGRDAAAEAGVVAARLTEVSANDEASAQLAAGVLGSEGLITPELFGELSPASSPGRRAATGRREKRSAVPTKQPAATAKARKEHQQALSRATRARDVAAKDLTRADAAVEKAAAAVRNAERQLEHARDALSAAEADRDGAARRLADAEDEVGAAERELDRATR
jgi:hypothetical protein